MALFKAKIDWKRLRKRENKKYRFVSFRPYPTRNRKFYKNSKKIEKMKKFHYGFISIKNRLKIMRQGENENYLSVPSLPET